MDGDFVEITDKNERRRIARFVRDDETRVSKLAERRERVARKCQFFAGMMKEFEEFRPTREDFEFEEKMRMRSELQKIEVGQIWEGQNQYGSIDKIQIVHIDTFDKSGGSGGCFDLIFEYTDTKGVRIPGKASWVRDHFHLLHQKPEDQFQMSLFEGDPE